jgi:hypothetical protein
LNPQVIREENNDMSGVTPYISMNRIAARLDELDTFESITEALDEVEYLFEVIPPELQEPAETLIALLRGKLNALK